MPRTWNSLLSSDVNCIG